MEKQMKKNIPNDEELKNISIRITSSPILVISKIWEQKGIVNVVAVIMCIIFSFKVILKCLGEM